MMSTPQEIRDLVEGWELDARLEMDLQQRFWFLPLEAAGRRLRGKNFSVSVPVALWERWSWGRRRTFLNEVARAFEQAIDKRGAGGRAPNNRLNGSKGSRPAATL